MYWTRVWNSWLCCTYQVNKVNQWTSAGFEASDDGMKQIAKKVGICLFIYTHRKTLCCILMCCTLIYTHTFFLCSSCSVDPHGDATPVNRHTMRHLYTPDTRWSEKLCSWWYWIRSSASTCLYKMPLCCTATTSASLDLTSLVHPFLMSDANKFSRDLRECNLSCNRNSIIWLRFSHMDIFFQ